MLGPKIWPVIVCVGGISFALIYLILSPAQIELLYFTNPRCKPAHTTDVLVEQLAEKFGDVLKVRIYVVKVFEDDPPDTDEVRELRETYEVRGVPHIVLGDKSLEMRYTEKNLLREICKNPRIWLGHLSDCVRTI